MMTWQMRCGIICLSGCCTKNPVRTMDIVLGVDGGNTKTIACVARGDGTIIGYARGAASDPYGYPKAEIATAEITRIVDLSLQMAGHSRTDISSACFSLAGADWQEDYDELARLLREEELGQEQSVVNDAIGALRAGSPDGTGIVVACGTGVATGARNSSGQFWHSSFWQEHMCGRALADFTLRAVLRTELGIDPPTALTEGVLTFFEADSIETVLYRLSSRHAKRPTHQQISKLAVILLDAANTGDATALALCQDHGIKLGEYGCVAARKVRLAEDEEIPLVLLGGVLRHQCPVIRETAIDYIRQRYPKVVPQSAPLEPVAGAVLLALEAARIDITDTIRENLTHSLPSPEFFATSQRLNDELP
jgi:N-acetylglucosamine kinase-like BadF-type ATPase